MARLPSHALAAAIKAGTPANEIVRLMLQANAVMLNSPRTLSSRRVRKASSSAARSIRHHQARGPRAGCRPRCRLRSWLPMP